MNDATQTLVIDVIRRVQRAIELGQAPAVVILDGDERPILSDYDYQRDADTAHAFDAESGQRIEGKRPALAGV